MGAKLRLVGRKQIRGGCRLYSVNFYKVLI
nr:MAG TPA: hypothetical protein [Caudoviricetes sp.]